MHLHCLVANPLLRVLRMLKGFSPLVLTLSVNTEMKTADMTGGEGCGQRAGCAAEN